MTTPVPPEEETPSGERVEPPDEPAPNEEPKKRRSPLVWVCAGLGVIAVGALVWAFATRSNLNDTQSTLDSTEAQLASTQEKLDAVPTATAAPQETPTPTPTETATPEEDNGKALLTVGAIGAVTALYKDLREQLGATQEDLAQTQADLDAANKQADQAQKDAAAAKDKAAQAGNETEKAQAEADEAKANQKAAESKLQIATDCAKSYISAFGTLFGADDVEAQAKKVRDQFSQIHDDCQAAFAGT